MILRIAATKELISVKTLVIIVTFPLKLLLDFAREMMVHLSSMTARFTDFTSVYSMTYFLVIGLIGMMSYAGINADYDVLYGLFYLSSGDKSWAFNLALISALAIGIGLYITTSNVTNVLAYQKYLASSGEEYMNHRIQLFLNSIVFLTCFISTITLSTNSDKAVKGKSEYLFSEKYNEEDSLETKKHTVSLSETSMIQSSFSLDSSLVLGKYTSEAQKLTKKERTALVVLNDKVAGLNARKPKNWNEKQWVKNEISKVKAQIDIINQEIENKEADTWKKYNEEMLLLSRAFSQKKDSLYSAISSEYKEKKGLVKKGLDKLEKDVTQAGNVFKYRNIVFNSGVVLLAIMLSLYFKGASQSHIHKIRKGSTKKPNENRNPKDHSLDNDQEEQEGSKSEKDHKVITRYKDFSKVCKRARKRFERSIDSAKIETRELNLVKSLADVLSLAEAGFSAIIEDGKLSLQNDGKGELSEEINSLIEQNRVQIKEHLNSSIYEED